jgi:poly(beta-D-mannuronate) lyase
LTLPTDRQRPGQADEIVQPKLATWPGDEHCFLTPKKDGVVFRAPCGGVTTKGSQYPRCELRQMQPEGRQPAAWSTDDTKPHTLELVAAITSLPPVKPHVVCAQIHHASDDLLMVRLEGTRLLIERPGENDVILEEAYPLGRRFALKIEAVRGVVQVQYEGRSVLTWPVRREGCYFKAGCYTQSNRRRGDEPTAYGEVMLYRLALSDCPAEPPCGR